MHTKITLLLMLFLCVLSSYADGTENECSAQITQSEKSDKIFKTNLAGLGIVTAWGVAQWDYFSRSPHSQSEGWFGDDTPDGGADKLGHLYSSYVVSHGLAALYKSWCFTEDDAALYGALSSFAILGYMELGDSFSDYGFSSEDMWMNALGSAAGYYLYKNKSLARKLDIRWEYKFYQAASDVLTDYENSKYLLALKFNGFDSMTSSWLKYFELHLGYYARGFYDLAVTRERNVYLGIGVNLTDMFRKRGHKKTAVFFNYMQLPGTYLAAERDINK